MEGTEQRLQERMTEALGLLLLGELPEEIDHSGCCDNCTKQACEAVNRLIRAFAQAREFLLSLSEGKLEADAPPRNFLISPFKQLHANLRHLTWQTQQITKGDLSQHVDFLGEFSTSFNAMIASLREKKAIEEALMRSQEALKRANELLERQATTDVLTGIPNRLKFNSALGREIRKAWRHRVPLSLIMFDIDHFKRINDTYGHHIGDLVLQELAGLIGKSIREEDILARWGGEEFVVLLPHTDRDGGVKLANRMLLKVAKNTFSVVNTVTCSFGVALFRKEDDGEAFVQRADKALYAAKGRGRNRVEVAED